MQIPKILHTSIWPRWAQHILFWACLVTFFALIMAIKASNFQAWMLYYSGIMLIFIPQTYLTTYWLIPQFIKKKQYLLFFLLFVPFNLLFALFELLLSNEILFPKLIPSYKMEGNYIRMITIFIFSVGDSYPMLIFLSVKYLKQWAHANDENQQLEEEKTRNELHLLHNKLDPPLLLKTLKHLEQQALVEDPMVPNLIITLSDFLSTILYDCKDNEVGIEQEISLIENYTNLLNALPNQKNHIKLSLGEIKGIFYIKPCLILRICEIFTTFHVPFKVEIKTIRKKLVIEISGNTPVNFAKIEKDLSYLHNLFNESFWWKIKDNNQHYKIEIHPLQGQKKTSDLPFTIQGVNKWS